MTRKMFEEKLSRIREQESKYGVKIELHPIDKDHLDCLWYGGEVGSITMKDGWKIVIGAYGDVRLCGMINGACIDVVDKSNSGRVYDELGSLLNDKQLHCLIQNPTETDYVVFGNNNWFEVDLVSPRGEFVDLFVVDNILDDNILSCFSNVTEYFEYVVLARSGDI